MRNGAAPSAVRVLSDDGVHPIAESPPPSSDRGRHRWAVPLLAAGGALLLFVGLTRPSSESAEEALPTTAPPPLSEVSAELIDLTSHTAVPVTTEWEEVNVFPDPGRIAAMFPYNNSVIAIGWTDEGAQVWLSSTGRGWRKAPRLETPDTPKSSIEHAALRDGDIVALGYVDDGVGLWTASNISHWVYHGTVAEMAGYRIVGLVGGDQYLAVGERDGFYEAWLSPDGLSWTSTGRLEALDDVVVKALSVHDGHYFAGGTEDCQEQRCRPVILRSADGMAWEAGGGALPGVLDADPGTVVDIATHEGGLIAVGSIGRFPETQIALWVSQDGQIWTRLAEDEPLFQPIRMTIELLSLSTTPTPSAVITIDGDRHQVTVGTKVATDGGVVPITAIGDSELTLVVDGVQRHLGLDAALLVQRAPTDARVATTGRRIVLGAAIGGTNSSVPTVWVSADAGTTWERTSVSTAAGSFGTPVLTGVNITLTGARSSNTSDLRHAQWDTTLAESAALELFHQFVDALNERNADAVIAAVPARAGTARPVFEIPSLGTAGMHWWDENSGMIAGDSIADTVAYLDRMDAHFTLNDCTPRVFVGDVDSIRINCDVTVTSDLLTTLSSGQASGTLVATVEAGVLRAVTEIAAPERSLWQMLIAGTEGAAASDRASLVGVDPGRPDPTFTAQSAEIHLRLAREFVAGLLRPGETKIVETALGLMEWQWIDTPPIPVYTLNWAVHTDDGFVALAQGEPGRWTEEVSLWSSPDGVTWAPGITPPDVDSMWNLQPFRGGFLAEAWRAEQNLLVLYDGAQWVELTVPDLDNPDTGLMRMATSSDTILALTGGWAEGPGPTASQAWLIGPDNVARRAALPPGVGDNEEIMGLVGSDDGFVMATSEFGTPNSMTIWHSSRGTSWSELAGTTSLEDAVFVWNLQQHRDKYFVVGDRVESSCSSNDEGAFCQQLVGMWSSPDGSAWDRVLTQSGNPVAAYEIGSGPLGLVAVAAERYASNGEVSGPRPLYFSPDAATWHRAGSLALLYPDVAWWYTQQPVVGDDAIVIPGAAYDISAAVDGDQPFLIVGRLLEP